MKWFKHPTDLWRDEGVRVYLDKYPRDRFAAYGFLTRVVEIIAERMNAKQGSLKCYATYPLTEWARLMECHRNALDKYLPNLALIDWVNVEIKEGSCRVNVPRLVEWRDETTRKSGATPEQVAQRREEKRRQEEKESRMNDSLSDFPTRGNVSRTPPEDFEPSEEMKSWARDQRPDLDIDHETAKFRIYEFPRPVSDWVPKWKKWILDARPSTVVGPPVQNKANRRSDLMALAPMLNIEQSADETEADYLSRVESANERRIAALNP